MWNKTHGNPFFLNQLVGALDVELQSIVVKGSLQSGIAFALRRLGENRLL